MAPMQQPILIVEDDVNTAKLVQTYLEREGFATLTASDGQTALLLADRSSPCFLILDIMLPKVDGWEVCRRLRRTSNVPILILSAREAEMERVLGLSIGADDYVVKPFSPRELVERVKAILRRSQQTPTVQMDEWHYGPLVLNDTKHKVTLYNIPVELTGNEYKLLRALMRFPGRVFSRDELLADLYNDSETVIDRVIDVHIGKLRQKIEPNPTRPTFIRTVRGIGYRLAEPGEVPGG